MVAHQEFTLRASHGFALTMGGYNAAVQKRKMATPKVTPAAISEFMLYLFETMDLAIECVLISYIYIKRLLLAGIMEIRKQNWRPLVFTAVLLASKFFEDISYWNINFVEVSQIYYQKSVNEMESIFLGLSGYKMFVSRAMYLRCMLELSDVSLETTDIRKKSKTLTKSCSMKMDDADKFF